MDAGNVIHHCLQKHYSEKPKIEQLKEFYIKEWEGFGLQKTRISAKQDLYWLMVLAGIEENLDVSSTEFKIFFDDVLGYLDAINVNDGKIWDYKSSERNEDNEKEYLAQASYYAWLFKRKFGKLPNEVKFLYLKHNGSN
jgi:hypothetical protein